MGIANVLYEGFWMLLSLHSFFGVVFSVDVVAVILLLVLLRNPSYSYVYAYMLDIFLCAFLLPLASARAYHFVDCCYDLLLWIFEYQLPD